MAKGSAFEREVCKKLSLWWTNSERDDVFWRSSNSGGRATARGKTGKRTAGSYGDVAAIDPVGKPLLELCTIEIKRGYSTKTPYDLIDKRDGAAIQQWEEWIIKAVRDSQLAGVPYWMLITKRDQRLTTMFMPFDLFSMLIWYSTAPDDSIRLAVEVRAKEPIYVDMIGVDFDWFLYNTTRKEIESALVVERNSKKKGG